jgi:hypothetical protein
MIGLQRLVELCGGAEAVGVGRRLSLKPLRRALAHLLDLGFVNPLVQVPMARDGNRIVATLEGVTFEAGSGQVAFEDLVTSMSDLAGDPAVGGAIERERASLGPAAPHAMLRAELTVLSVSGDRGPAQPRDEP